MEWLYFLLALILIIGVGYAVVSCIARTCGGFVEWLYKR